MKIIGAGLAGLVAANMLRRFKPEILEVQPSLPHNHAALLRFRSNAVSQATGIPFKKVTVHKAICHKGVMHDRPTLALNNLYSYKVTGRVVSRSILNTETAERFIAPPDFISQLAASANISYGCGLDAQQLRSSDSEPMISTMPMPALMGLWNWKERPTFLWRNITSVRIKLDNCDVYQTVYYPGKEVDFYRASITGDTLIIEYLLAGPTEDVVESDVMSVLTDFGLLDQVVPDIKQIEVKEQKYGKLMPTDPDACRRFILWMTDHFRIYSLGRFATWRQILMDDVVKDVGVIERLIEYRDGYAKTLQIAK